MCLVSACASKKISAFRQQELKCIRDCEAENPAGTALYESFQTCMTTTCGRLDPESDAYDDCTSSAFDPSNPDAACKAQTQACFSGPIAGCRELLAFTEDRCEPATLPVTDEMGLLTMTWCIIESGFRATPPVQAKAWPLLWCVMDENAGCGFECGNGRQACRACAAERCGEPYGACLADSAPFVEPVMPADKQACQDTHTCVNFCLSF